MRLFDAAGSTVVLGREIGRGGEGAVFEVTHDATTVAKVYHTAVSPIRAQKLKTMSRMANAELLQVAAWPTGTLHNNPGGELVGVLFPRVANHREIHQLYSPAQRKIHFPRSDWSFLIHAAMNCAGAFETIHGAGHIVGDVNQSGVMVSDRGTVCLIDCDSFQIRSNGQLYHCVVGVPQYTPPELQGLHFGGVERTQNHDCFGLALLVFHLLFMGRHPFAGRFHGSQDMPIEKAISEGRFAFSRMAQAYQMSAPPHSLPLELLPKHLGDMFERAFTRPNAGHSRPSATEWHGALFAMKQALRHCSSDRGHLYPSHASACPWCDIIRGGGPNFFISIQVVAGGIGRDLPALDLDALWRAIEAVARPLQNRPPYPATARPTFTPLPETAQDQRILLRLSRIVTIIALIVLVVGFATEELVRLSGGAVAVVFGVLWLVLENGSQLKQEIRRRREAVRRLRSELKFEQDRWDETTADHTNQFNVMKDELVKARSLAMQIPTYFTNERHQLEMNRAQNQLQEFLQQRFIRDHHIPSIGRGRVATLLSYGVETAADIQEAVLRDIPGFGPATISKLVSWREQISQIFVFDPTRAAPPAPMQALVMKYTQQQQICEMKLRRGASQLQALTNACDSEHAHIVKRIQDLVPRLRQAEADVDGL